MNSRQLEPYLLLLYNRVPLIGGWVRRRVARALAREGSPVAVGALAEAVARSEDKRVRAIALESLGQLTEPRCIDVVCAVWATTRQPDLAALISERQWIASAPIEVKTLCALHTRLLMSVTRGGPSIVQPLVAACLDQDAGIAEQARLALGKLTNPKTRLLAADHLCAQWAATRSPQLEEVMLRERFVAAQPPAVRVLSALKNQQPELLLECGAEAVEPLVQSCEDRDAVIVQQSHLALRRLKSAEAKDALCRLVIEQETAAAGAAALEAGYAPRDEHQRALFFF